jgi:hypothetical protein
LIQPLAPPLLAFSARFEAAAGLVAELATASHAAVAAAAAAAGGCGV